MHFKLQMQMIINVNDGKLTQSQYQTLCLHAVITTVAINVIANDTKHTEKWFYLWLLKKLSFTWSWMKPVGRCS